MMRNITQNITFYSYKGGVGRSLALVNIAFHLTRLGKSVLIWELDLEAPGLLRIPIFESLATAAQGGMVDLLVLVDPELRLDAIRSSLKKWVLPFQDETHPSFKLHIFPAGLDLEAGHIPVLKQFPKFHMLSIWRPNNFN